MSFNPENIKVTSGRDSSYRSGDVKSRPVANAKSRKDFKKVLEKPTEEDESENPEVKEIIEESSGVVPEAQEGEDKKKAPAPSLFDLTSGKATFTPGKAEEGLPLAKAAAPMQMYSQLSSIDSRKMPKNTPFDLADKDSDSGKEKFTTRFATEQPDLSSVNPLAAIGNTQSTQPITAPVSMPTEKAAMPSTNIQQIINQMLEKVMEIKNSGTTETVVTLKNPPLFEGATIVVTAFDHAKNEFNISIENLTQAAKNLVDQQSNRDSLLSNLQQKGYAVHIMTTTTTTETRPVIAAATPEEEARERRRDDEQDDGKQRKRGQ